MVEEKKEERQKVQPEEQKEQASGEREELKLSPQARKLVETIEGMSVLELSKLVQVLEERFGVSAAIPQAPVAAAGAPGAAAAPAPEEEKTTFNVQLTQVGSNKIQVIKEIRAITNLGLKEAKDLVDSAPKPIKEGVGKEEAEEIKKRLTAVGATVELQ